MNNNKKTKKQRSQNQSQEEIEFLKMKITLKKLRESIGIGTSVITMIMPAGRDQLSKATHHIIDELGKAKNIKSRKNKQSVITALLSAQNKLKMITHLPKNGLALFCGAVEDPDGKERKTSVMIEPLKPVRQKVYLCDKRFHTEVLERQLVETDKYGFIIIDGHGCLFGTLSGSVKTVLHKFTVDLPKKHNKGGQSKERFQRQRLEARHNYIRKVSEQSKKCFFKDGKIAIKGIVLAGSADLKKVLNSSDLLDYRLRDKIISVVDINYGFNNGFTQAINLTQEKLNSLKLIKEKKIVNQLFDNIRLGNNKTAIGAKETISALTDGMVETLIVWDSLEMMRYEVVNTENEKSYLHLSKKESEKSSNFIDRKLKTPLKILSKIDLFEWLLENYSNYSSNISVVTDNSSEGSQFVQGFNGIAAILRYAKSFDYDSDDDDSDNFDFFNDNSPLSEDSEFSESDSINNNQKAVTTKKKIVVNRIQKPPKQNIRKSLSKISPIIKNGALIIKDTGKERLEGPDYSQYLIPINPHKKIDCELFIRLLLFDKQLKIS
ncbi:eukaryotic peptide chain release factor subunit [Anaeramoeba flamelloides]|uniref:Eukaryotic peptide chain release factor subunit n=1 Tax=Anaeramoeba flamelloides TaxID=1746091 RepID=A0AAV8AJU7_9EUKA|nr:eukaryotic peptide chain release factor subunit [Anaeramoeba flamelloides]